MGIRRTDLATAVALVAGGALVVGQARRLRRQVRRRERLAHRAVGPIRRIVVVGVGFAGLAAINRLGKLVGGDPRFEVLLIDRHTYHLFYPLLYQVATGGVEAGQLAYPARYVVRRHGFRYLEANVTGVDLVQKRLETDVGPIEFDGVILAPGSVTNYFGMADALQNALPLKSLQDGVCLRNQVVECFEAAEQESDPRRRRALLSFVVVGGGATGVELTASLSDLIFTALLPNYPGLSPHEVRLVLIETKPSLLSGWNPKMGEIALSQLRRQHVEVRLNATVTQVTAEGVGLRAGERLPATTVIWTAGVRAEPLVERIPGEKERDGRIRVDEHLELPGYPGSFVVGDAASVRDPTTGRPLAPTAPVAIDEGAVAAENLYRRLCDEPLLTYRYRSKGDLVSLGRGAAAADLLGWVFDGLLAWFIRRGVYLVNLVGFRSRVMIVLDWAFVAFHQRVIASVGPLPRQAPVPAARERAASREAA